MSSLTFFRGSMNSPRTGIDKKDILQDYAAELGRSADELKKRLGEIKETLAVPLRAVLGEGAKAMMSNLENGTLDVMMSNIQTAMDAYRSVKASA